MLIVIVALILIILLLLLHNLRTRRKRTTLVITLSPANHSPRALAHATTISQHTSTIFFAFPPFPHPNSSTTLIYHPLYTSPHPTSLPKKLFLHSFSLAIALLQTLPKNVSTIIINTPPALPTLPLILFFARPLFPTATLIIDWHNLAYTLMPSTSSLTPCAKFIETKSASFAHKHWTVSKAMANYLQIHFSIRPTVIYDTPRTQFLKAARSVTPLSKSGLFTRLSQLATRIGPSHHLATTDILVTSTSWTPDEHFHVLYHALLSVDKAHHPLIVVITGRGPLRETFENRFRQANLNNVAIWMAWLPIHDYPRLLASATLGLSLHASSSGLDLPMKVVDMLACGLPVLALRYHCIHELVKHGVNGFLFQDTKHLAILLRQLLLDHSLDIHRLREGVHQTFEQGMEWESYWQRTALPTIPSLS